jgi:hypothetical protein
MGQRCLERGAEVGYHGRRLRLIRHVLEPNHLSGFKISVRA